MPTVPRTRSKSLRGNWEPDARSGSGNPVIGGSSCVAIGLPRASGLRGATFAMVMAGPIRHEGAWNSLIFRHAPCGARTGGATILPDHQI